MRRRPPRATRTDTLFPDTTLFRAAFASTGRRAQSGLGKARGARSIFLPPVSLRQHGRRVRSRRASDRAHEKGAVPARGGPFFDAALSALLVAVAVGLIAAGLFALLAVLAALLLLLAVRIAVRLPGVLALLILIGHFSVSCKVPRPCHHDRDAWATRESRAMFPAMRQGVARARRPLPPLDRKSTRL